MTKTAVVYSPKYLQHKTNYYHPEVPSRLRVITRELNKSGILRNNNCSIVEPEKVNMSDLENVHDKTYIQKIRQFCNCGGGFLDKDTFVSSESYDVALLAAGGAVKATNLVIKRKYDNAFALVRPPGHHAGSDYAMGFCVFNNIAVATSNLIENFDLDRIAIVDIDSHHGNGTQEIFWRTNKVLYVSLHEDPIEFPLTGFINDVGEDEGLGYSVNIPLPYGTDDKIYLRAFKEIAATIINQYDPQFILVSTGFDNYYADPIGNLYLSKFGYTKIFDGILESVSKSCQGKLVAILEGGYNLRFLGKITCQVIAKMAEVPFSFLDKPRCSTPKIRKKAEKILQRIKKTHSTFWNLR
jgi:acetoin utilization deacetylase AcuC-like enzyme